ncbi:hypothetical protein EDB19DRAFT_2022198 [Suillus lakei]|nr:hypothetical protein EDB19DRAFT_2022198 [Suillus lakei]
MISYSDLDVSQRVVSCQVASNDETSCTRYAETPDGILSTNLGLDAQQVIVHDIRGKEDTVGLDKTGFQFVTYKSVEKDFVDEEVVKTKYYAEVEDILKKYTGAKRVVIFHHTIRRSQVDGVIPPKGVRVPVQRAHADQTSAAAIDLVYRHLGDDAERLLKGRFRIINVWRPIANLVAHFPLAVVDYRTINPEKDLVSARIIAKDHECYDLDEDKAHLLPHSSFSDVTSPKDAPDRQSIELGVLVFDIEYGIYAGTT